MLGDELGTLRTLRAKADYRPDLAVVFTEAQDAVNQATYIVTELGADLRDRYSRS
jgi:hypothetical protein